MNPSLSPSDMARLRRAARQRAVALRDAELDAAWAAVLRLARRVISAGRRARPEAARLA
jgi:hypothetical protein